MPRFSENTLLGPTPRGELLFGTRAHSLVFASGRQISSTTLFPLLHWGGWLAFGAIPFAWTFSSWGFLGSLLNNLWFVVSGALVSLGLRVAYRRARLSKVSFAVLAPAVLIACAVFAEVWYAGDLLVVRWCFQQLAEVSS